MVSLYVDGSRRLFSTNSQNVGDVLKHAGVKLGSGDIVEPAAATSISHGQFNINVYRAHPVLVEDGLRSYRIHSAHQSPRLLAIDAGIKVYPEDTYSSGIITDFVQNSAVGEKVTIKRAKPLQVKVDGGLRTIRTQAGTVGAALKAADISLGVKDTVSQSLNTQVVPGMAVAITRVTEALVTQTQTLPRPVQTVDDPTVLKGTTTVKDPGSDGQKTITYRIHYTNGIETSREVVQVVSETAPQPQVVSVGTKVLFAGTVEYWRPQVVAAATANGLDPNMMLRIMNCETHGNASDVSGFVINGQHPTGLFQFLPSTWATATQKFGSGTEDIMDGSAQIKIAAAYMAANGTGAWQCK
jgi:uncharacterized protein YabE (DUF348 family)